MKNVSAEEIKKILETIDHALDSHTKWYEQLVRTLLCRTRMEDALIAKDAHYKCGFGSWFYSNKESGFYELPAFITIGELHKTMHDSARDICLKMNATGLVQGDDYDYFLRNMTHFREALTDFRKRVLDTLEQISH